MPAFFKDNLVVVNNVKYHGILRLIKKVMLIENINISKTLKILIQWHHPKYLISTVIIQNTSGIQANLVSNVGLEKFLFYLNKFLPWGLPARIWTKYLKNESINRPCKQYQSVRWFSTKIKKKMSHVNCLNLNILPC